ncbi:type VI secretion system-associated protein TagO [Bradyrhizobium sp. CB3481]|uniref:type VI secretion system-associated protein TagO n=1 Tax=Bradyrhizobium sp. CB3481 TaxID=3039158 RepID=UPI0024B1B1BA|nr:type VI secretion system-associated protein TagO [Bradyrhizobium sp. CB3481]WFU18477.1 type VI secretion system-associated protein TagO [Bradyrhizobium sp. CB3481]
MLLGLSEAICAQIGADDAIDRLKACSQFDSMERLKCIDELLKRTTEAPDSEVSPEPNWIISETTSPVDYSPQIVAVTKADPSSSQDAPASLAIRCRARRTELTISTSGFWRQDGEVTVAYRINEAPPVEARWKPADNGRSLAFTGDVVRLLRSMPASGHMLVKIYAGKSAPNEGTFRLAGLEAVRRKIASMCNWPHPE